MPAAQRFTLDTVCPVETVLATRRVVEIFSRDVPASLWERDLTQAIAGSRAGLGTAWRAAFLHRA